MCLFQSEFLFDVLVLERKGWFGNSGLFMLGSNLKAPIKCPVAMMSLLVRDQKLVRKRATNRASSFKKRNILRRASNRRLPQPKRLAKRSKASQPAPAVWDKWPILRPYDLMKEFASSGLESELCLDAINHFSECFIFLGKVWVGRLVIHTAPETLLQVWPGGLATVLVAGIL